MQNGPRPYRRVYPLTELIAIIAGNMIFPFMVLLAEWISRLGR